MSVHSQGRGGGSDASVGCIAGDASIVASLGLGVDLGDGAGDRVDGDLFTEPASPVLHDH